LERLKNSSQPLASIQEADARRGGAAWYESARTRVAKLAACREADIRPRKPLRSGLGPWPKSCKVAPIAIVLRPVWRGEELT
jgi:hypothetical protein